MTSISAARRASTAAKAVAKETSSAQVELKLSENNLKLYDAQVKGFRAALSGELQKTPPNQATVTALRNSIETFSKMRDAEKAKLPALREQVKEGFSKQGAASAKALKEERAILDVKEQLEKDQFSAESTAKGQRAGAKVLAGTAGTLDAIEKSLKEKLKDKSLTHEQRKEIKAAIASLNKGEAKLECKADQLEGQARTSDRKAAKAERKLDQLKPVSDEAERRLTEDVKQFIELNTGGVTGIVGSAVGEHQVNTSGAGDIAQVDSVLNSANNDRAMSAWQRVDAVAGKNTQAAARLTPEIRQMLVQGVAQARTADSLGQEGVLSQRQAEAAAKALAEMPQARYDALVGLLDKAGGPSGDAQTERALILKAVAARSDKLGGSSISPQAQVNAALALGEVAGFATEIRGEKRDDLVKSTTTIDIDGSENRSLVRPEDFENRQNPSDPYKNNDGLYQRYESSCAPTTAQIVRGEADPIAARRLNREGINSADTSTGTAQQQKNVLAANGSTATSRRAEQALDRAKDVAKNQLGFGMMQRIALELEMRGESNWITKKYDGPALLAQVQAKDGGSPRADQLGWIRTEMAKDPGGMDTGVALDTIASGATGVKYQRKGMGASNTVNWNETKKDGTVVPHSLTVAVPNAADFAAWDARLKDGQDIPFRVDSPGGSGGHAMTIDDVRDTPVKQYLVSDPYSGSTSWITQAEMTAGLNNQGRSWIDAHFGVGWKQMGGFYVEK